MKEAAVSAAEELDLLVKWLCPVSATYAISIRSSNGSNPTLGRQILWERLDERYGSPEVIESALKSKLDIKVTEKDNTKMYDLVDILTEILVLKENPQYSLILEYYDSPLGVRQIVLKLPTSLQLKWTDRAAGYKLKHKAMFPPFSYFVNFIKEMTSVMNDPGLALTVAEATQHGGGSRRQDFNRGPGISVKKTTLLNETTVVNGQKSCPIHPEVNSHSLCDCREFMKKSLTNRKQFLKDKSICYRCCS